MVVSFSPQQQLPLEPIEDGKRKEIKINVKKLKPISIRNGKALFWGCRVKTLTQFIAFFQIIVSLVIICYCFLHTSSSTVDPRAILGFFLIFLLAWILVLGAYLKLPELLFLWLIVTIVKMVILFLVLVTLIFTFFFYGYDTFVLSIFFILVMQLAITLFSFPVVSMYRRELSYLRQQMDQIPSPLPFQSVTEQTDLDCEDVVDDDDDLDFDIDDDVFWNPEVMFKRNDGDPGTPISASGDPPKLKKSDSIRLAFLSDPLCFDFDKATNAKLKSSSMKSKKSLKLSTPC